MMGPDFGMGTVFGAFESATQVIHPMDIIEPNRRGDFINSSRYFKGFRWRIPVEILGFFRIDSEVFPGLVVSLILWIHQLRILAVD